MSSSKVLQIGRTAIIIGICLLGLASGSYWASHSTLQPKIVMQTQENAGTVWRGETLKRRVRIANTGNAPLTLDITSTSCGCTSAYLTKPQLAPGESGYLRANIAINVSSNHWQTSVSLATNDPLHPTSVVTFQGTARDLLTLSTDIVRFERPHFSELPISKHFNLVSPEDVSTKELLSGLRIETNREFIKTDVHDNSGQPELVVTLSENAPLGILTDILYLNYEQVSIPVRVTAEVQGDIKVSPSTLFFSAMRRREEQTLTCEIGGLTPLDQITVDEASLADKPYLSLDSIRTDETLRLIVTLTAPDRTGVISENLVLKLKRKVDGRETPVLVPILAKVS